MRPTAAPAPATRVTRSMNARRSISPCINRLYASIASAGTLAFVVSITAPCPLRASLLAVSRARLRAPRILLAGSTLERRSRALPHFLEDIMRVDLYTRVVLTAIAFFLGWICVDRTAIPVHSQADTRVILAGWVDASGDIQKLPRDSPWKAQGLPIVVNNDPIDPVTVRSTADEPLPVRIAESTPIRIKNDNANALAVKLQDSELKIKNT